MPPVLDWGAEDSRLAVVDRQRHLPRRAGRSARRGRNTAAGWRIDPHARAARDARRAPAFRRILAVASSGQRDGPGRIRRSMPAARPATIRGGIVPCRPAMRSCSARRRAGRGDARDRLRIVPRRGRALAGQALRGAASSRGDLAALGMTATQRTCLSAAGRVRPATLGDADHDLNHDMLAAGHPPLRFELSAYHDLIRRKHWPAARADSDIARVRRCSCGPPGRAAAIENARSAAFWSPAARRAVKARQAHPLAGARRNTTASPATSGYGPAALHYSSAGSKPAPGDLSGDVRSKAPGPGFCPGYFGKSVRWLARLAAVESGSRGRTCLSRLSQELPRS